MSTKNKITFPNPIQTEIEMKLYRIELSNKLENISTVYVLAESPDLAENIIRTALNEADYGFSNDRHVIKIELLAVQTIYGKAPQVGILFQKDVIIKGLEPKKKITQ